MLARDPCLRGLSSSRALSQGRHGSSQLAFLIYSVAMCLPCSRPSTRARTLDSRCLQDFSGPGLPGDRESRPGAREVFVSLRPEPRKPPVAKSESGIFSTEDLERRSEQGRWCQLPPSPARWALGAWAGWPSHKSPAALI